MTTVAMLPRTGKVRVRVRVRARVRFRVPVAP